MTPEELKIPHDKLQIELPQDLICIRKGIVLNIGLEDYPRFGFEFFCYRSSEMVREMDCFIKYAKSRKCLLDIGAFHGLFSFVFNKINEGSTCYAFEPYEIPLQVLVNNAHHYPNLRIFQNALSDENKEEIFYTYEEHLQHIRVNEAQSEKKVIKVIGDDFCQQFNVIPDTIKCDVEGHEWHTINGLKETIIKFHPTIFLELHFELCSKEEIGMLLDFIIAENYKIINSEDDKPITRQEIEQRKLSELRLILL